jgi:aspartyl-tRNA synthetase
MMRSRGAGTLRLTDADSTVTLAGWVARRRDHGGVAFVDLRDTTGLAQVVVRDEAAAHGLRPESCLQVVGTVAARPAGNENPDLPTGQVEVIATQVRLLSPAAPLPFPVEDAHAGSVGEEVRLRHRYLDLRRGETSRAIRMRSEVSRVARSVLHEEGFVEVETPTLTRSTPEGARDFLVPVRLQPGHWYALPQSPQLFKQLLMVGGLERYYQIARCYRDEDFRADRQPEFTQLDVEMSFVDEDDVIAVAEDVMAALWSQVAGYDIARPIPRMTYAEAMARYGTDKPDLRYPLELVELTPLLADTEFRVFQAPYVGAVRMPGGASQTRRELDGWQDWARTRGARGLAYLLVQPDGSTTGPVAKNLSDTEREGILSAVGATAGDAVFFAAGEPGASRYILGATRVEIARRLDLADPRAWAFVWVVDAPMFEWDHDEGRWNAVHHPFTAPAADWADRFAADPEHAVAAAYDLVCNGNELGGGSIRVHDAVMQEKVFGVLGIAPQEAREKFGFLLEAFRYGPPPHGGIAFGWDRICMLLAGADSLRDVIAFPKTGAGYDPLTGAPTPITAAQRREAGIDAVPKDADRAVAGNAPRHAVIADERRS